MSIYSVGSRKVLICFSLFAEVLFTGKYIGYHFLGFELCQKSLYDVAVCPGKDNISPLPTRQLAEISYQLLKALKCECSCCNMARKLTCGQISIRYI